MTPFALETLEPRTLLSAAPTDAGDSRPAAADLGAIQPGGGTWRRELIGGRDRADYFRLTLPAPAELHARFLDRARGASLHLEHSTGAVLQQSVRSDGVATADTTHRLDRTLPAGTYYLAVRPVSPLALRRPGGYTLRLRTLPTGNAPELPRVFLDTTYAPSITGRTIHVPAGGNVQAALDAAQPGDTIALAAGATFTGNFTLSDKPGDSWITVRTDAPDSSLPAPGTRLTPAHAPLLPKLVSPNSLPALATRPGAHHWRFVGVEFTVADTVASTPGIVHLGSGGETSAEDLPHDLVLDRCYVHGNAAGDVQNGVRLNSAATAIVDSTIDECHARAFESHCIGGFNGPGPFKIVNNFLGGSTINVLFGGAVPRLPNLVPSDIEFRGNTCSRPTNWRQDAPDYAGVPWYVKNLFELKNASRVLIEGNVFEHNWPHPQPGPDNAAQHGWAMLLTVRDESGRAPWAVVEDVTVRSNVVRHSNAGFSLYGVEGGGSRRILIENNLVHDVGLAWGANDRTGMLMQVNGVSDLIVNHNTAVHDGDTLFANGPAAGGLRFTNNIVNHDAARTINRNYGVNGPGTGPGLPTLNTRFPGPPTYVFTRNALRAGRSYAASYPSENYFSLTWAEVGFVNPTAGDWRLSPISPYRNAATDGTDLGFDADALLAVATAR
ncbi:MAG TPA: LEPR-XLL domain-containing protein [Tepidisphaeraceae bacterium]|nr:LEPR-XLL domain-containing protein [Tepidisphaeraceae bacterium]